uniref:Uncharacterized protein n=1 Tax=viral metagenome TaxID=1070528 RepID=A0A6C0LKN2_9ZZZZ
MSSISSSDEQLEVLVDLLCQKKSHKEIQAILKLSKQKLKSRLEKIAVLLFEDNKEFDHIRKVTGLSEIHLKKIIDEKRIRDRYNRDLSIKKMLKEINKKQDEIQNLQERIVSQLNGDWEYN